MTDSTETKQSKPLTLAGAGRLDLKPKVEAGQVRQKFSHGRTKAVTVEVKKKRVVGPTPAPAAPAPAPAPTAYAAAAPAEPRPAETRPVEAARRAGRPAACRHRAAPVQAKVEAAPPPPPPPPPPAPVAAAAEPATAKAPASPAPAAPASDRRRRQPPPTAWRRPPACARPAPPRCGASGAPARIVRPTAAPAARPQGRGVVLRTLTAEGATRLSAPRIRCATTRSVARRKRQPGCARKTTSASAASARKPSAGLPKRKRARRPTRRRAGAPKARRNGICATPRPGRQLAGRAARPAARRDRRRGRRAGTRRAPGPDRDHGRRERVRPVGAADPPWRRRSGRQRPAVARTCGAGPASRRNAAPMTRTRSAASVAALRRANEKEKRKLQTVSAPEALSRGDDPGDHHGAGARQPHERARRRRDPHPG